MDFYFLSNTSTNKLVTMHKMKIIKKLFGLYTCVLALFSFACESGPVKDTSIQTQSVGLSPQLHIHESAFITKTNLVIRAEPTTASKVIGRLVSGKIITGQKENGWVQIIIESSGHHLEGYVSAKYLSKVSELLSKGIGMRGSSLKEYDYDVSGYDEEGNYVTGSVTVDQDGGTGILYDENDNEIEINVDWDGYGELSGEDDNGTSYDLETE